MSDKNVLTSSHPDILLKKTSSAVGLLANPSLHLLILHAYPGRLESVIGRKTVSVRSHDIHMKKRGVSSHLWALKLLEKVCGSV